MLCYFSMVSAILVTVIQFYSGSSGSAVFGPLPPNRRRRYTITIEATFRDEALTIERRFRSGIYSNNFRIIYVIVTL